MAGGLFGQKAWVVSAGPQDFTAAEVGFSDIGLAVRHGGADGFRGELAETRQNRCIVHVWMQVGDGRGMDRQGGFAGRRYPTARDRLRLRYFKLNRRFSQVLIAFRSDDGDIFQADAAPLGIVQSRLYSDDIAD